MKDQKASYNGYWKLEDHTKQLKSTMVEKIQALGYKNLKTSLTKQDLANYLERADRGLLCYEKCTNKEIEAFAHARNIRCYINTWTMTTSEQRDWTIEGLMNDDASPRFKRFLELPPELRNRIYELYDDHFETVLHLPTKPPIAQTCRQVFNEMLPIFYSKHEFEMIIERSHFKSSVFRERSSTQIWLSHVASEHAVHIKSLQIAVWDIYLLSTSKPRSRWVGDICLWFDRKADEWSYQLEATEDEHVHCDWDSDRIERLGEEFRKVSENLQDVGGRKRLKLQDIHDLRKAISAAYR